MCKNKNQNTQWSNTPQHKQSHDHSHTHSHNHEAELSAKALIISITMLVAGLLCEHFAPSIFCKEWIKACWYIIAYLPVAWPVIVNAWNEIKEGTIFSEFSLMLLASVGALAIGEYSEAVGLMIFYGVGEMLQERATSKARSNIKSLIDMKPSEARVIVDGKPMMTEIDKVEPGMEIEVLTGERIPLDGQLLSLATTLDTSALTGESEPRSFASGDEVLAGMIAVSGNMRIKVLRHSNESALSRIMNMVEEAEERKAPNELFIRKFAKVYTPIVVAIAVIIAILPHISNWLGLGEIHLTLYQALVFLVISCPCALVLSVPLAYFRAIGLASRHGILFKGGSPLDALCKTNAVVFDKTGTLTNGIFSVSQTTLTNEDFQLLASIEASSNHPIAKAITSYASQKGLQITTGIEVSELAGIGLQATINGNKVKVGNSKLFSSANINVEDIIQPEESETAVHLIINNVYRGFVGLIDTPKAESALAIKDLKQLGIDNLAVLSGDRTSIVAHVANKLGIGVGKGNLMPEDKTAFVEQMSKEGNNVAFVGDGINDAPVMAASQVAFAMGTGGSDVAVETADIVLHGDNPQKVGLAIRLARNTRRLIIFNITLALAFKLLIMAADIFGFASMWLAVLADTGVALICVALTALIRMPKNNPSEA